MIRKITLLVALFTMTIGTAQNLAAGKTTTASFNEGSSGGGNLSFRAVDGDGGTRWESAQGNDLGEWWMVDLGASYDLGQIIISWEGAYGKDYNILISDDDVTYTTLISVTDGNGGIDDLSVSGTGRYVKFEGITRGLPYGYSFYEFEVYEAVAASVDATLSDLTVNGTTVTDFLAMSFTYDVELPVGTTVVPTVVGTPTQGTASAVVTNAASLPGTTTVLVTAEDGTTTQTYTLNFTVDKENIAEGKTGTASRFEGDNTIGFNADFAFDGNLGTRWSSYHRGADDHLDDIYVDLEAIYSVSGVNLTWNSVGSYGIQFIIQVSEDASTWTDVFTQGNSGRTYSKVEDISFTAANARYVRMYGVEKATYGYSLLEFEVYGTYFGEVVGIDKVEDLSFSVYPNPTTGIVNIQTEGTVENAAVYDVSGRSLLQTESNTIDIQNLSNGVYILKVTVDGVVKTTKIIKQ